MKKIQFQITDDLYKRICAYTKSDIRLIQNYIENAILNQLEIEDIVDSGEMKDINNNSVLTKRLKKGSLDAHLMNGKLIG